MPTAPINGIQLYYELHGEGPSAIVFAHGAAGNHLSWFQQVPFFSKKYRCITLDQRGFHGSPDLPDGPGAASFVDDLASLLDYLEIKETALVGQSMSGFTCFNFALTYPERTKALVMSGTIQGIPSTRLREALVELRKGGRHVEDPLTDGNYALYFRKREPELEFLYREITTLNFGYGKKQFGATRPSAKPDADLDKLRAPVLFIFGMDDENPSPEARRLAQSLVPGSRFVEVEGSGHSPYFERPHEFNRIVSEFLDEVGV